jgi:hypothetical protein
MLILKITTGYYNTYITFNRYRRRGLSDTLSGQTVLSWKRNNNSITVSLRLLLCHWDLKMWLIIPPSELILFGCSVFILSQQYMLPSQ